MDLAHGAKSWDVFCLGIANIYVEMSQTQMLSSHRDHVVAQGEDVQKIFPLDNAVQEEQVWLWVHLPITDA